MIERIVRTLFRVSTLVFLLGGLAIVVGQAGGIVAGNGAFVTGVEEMLAPWAYGASGVAGLLSFVLMYFTDSGADTDEAPRADVADGAVTPRSRAA